VCTFPLKIIGLADDAWRGGTRAVVLRHAPDFDAATMETRSSSAGKYVSLTCTIHATSQGRNSTRSTGN
jgi:putative lipoic acid-binding regulatory protein